MTSFWQQVASTWGAGGWILLPLAAVCMGIWFLFFHSRDHLVQVLSEGRALEHNISRLEAGDLNRPGTFHAFLRQVWTDIQAGAPARSCFQDHESRYMDGLRRDLVVLSALTAVAPLLGLLGTVIGMMQTFDAVAGLAGETGSAVAGGVSTSLITTQFGLVVALPGVFCIARLRSLLSEMQLCLGSVRAQVLVRWEQIQSLEVNG